MRCGLFEIWLCICYGRFGWQCCGCCWLAMPGCARSGLRGWHCALHVLQTLRGKMHACLAVAKAGPKLIVLSDFFDLRG